MTQSQKELINRYLRTEWESHRRSIENAKANVTDKEKLQNILAWNEARKADIIAVNAIIEAILIKDSDNNDSCPF